MIDPSFQGVNRFFVLPYKNNALRTNQRRYFLPILEIKHFNIMIDGRNFFDQPPYLWYKKICKLQVLHADSKLKQHIYFTSNLDWAGKKTMLFTLEEVTQTILDFPEGTIWVLSFYF